MFDFLKDREEKLPLIYFHKTTTVNGVSHTVTFTRENFGNVRIECKVGGVRVHNLLLSVNTQKQLLKFLQSNLK